MKSSIMVTKNQNENHHDDGTTRSTTPPPPAGRFGEEDDVGAFAAEKKKSFSLQHASLASVLSSTSSESSKDSPNASEKTNSRMVVRFSMNDEYVSPVNENKKEETKKKDNYEDDTSAKKKAAGGLRLAGVVTNNDESVLSDENANGHLSLSYQTSQDYDSATRTNQQTNSLGIGAFSLGGSRDEDILEEDPELIEAQLVPAEQDIPHAVVHTIDEKAELQKQEEQRRKDMKSRRRQMAFWTVLVMLSSLGVGLGLGFSRDSPAQEPPSTLAPTSKATTIASSGSLASDMMCDLSIECARQCCSNAYSLRDGIAKCIPVDDLNSPACISNVSLPISPPVNNSNSSTEDLPYVGSYFWTWGDGVNVQDDPNESFSVAFSGWTDINSALWESEKVLPRLRGDKYISFGGSTENGRWTEDALLVLVNATSAGLLGSYDGIVYSIIGGDSGLVDHFLNSFAVAKSNGLKVMVTISSSAPSSIADGSLLMTAFLNDTNIDVISPILYAGGSESSNLYAESNGVLWSNYTNARPAIVPGLVRGGQYFSDAKNFFLMEYGISIQGYIRWSQT